MVQQTIFVIIAHQIIFLLHSEIVVLNHDLSIGSGCGQGNVFFSQQD
jgi:hypothetical protein